MVYIRRIVVVCGYGCDLDSPLKPYLDRVVKFCEDQRPSFIILCGGATQQKSFPDKTEASVMYGYLCEKLVHLDWCPSWFIKDESFTTYENVRDATAIITRFKGHPWFSNQPRHDEITIFCEATRALKIAILVRHFLGFPPERGEPDIRIETDSWERMHPVMELIGTIKDFLATMFPFVNILQSRTRRRKALTR